MAATVAKYVEQGTATDVLTTELNSLSSGSNTSAGTAINNVVSTSNWDGNREGHVQFTMAAYTGTPSAGAALYLWWLQSVDANSTYEDGSSSVTPQRPPDLIIPIRAVASGPQKITVFTRRLPVGYFKPLAQSSGIGLSLASSGNKVTILPGTMEGV